MKTTKELFGQLQKEIIIHTKYKEDFTSIPSGFYHLGDLKTGEIIGILGPNSEKLVTFALSTAISAA